MKNKQLLTSEVSTLIKKHIEEDQFCACGNIKMDESEFCEECV